MKDEIYSGHVDAMADILQNLGIEIHVDKIQQIAKDFKYHLDLCQEMDNTQFRDYKAPECESCKRLKSKVSEMERDEQAYKKWIATATARHNGVHADDVYVSADRYGSVNLDRR